MVPKKALRTAMTTVILTGPTATGKTSLALELAESHGNVEIINADSLLVYRGMDIGTAKPTAVERRGITHHLIDIREPDEPYTAGDFIHEVMQALELIHAKGSQALIVGGTGFYLKALLYGMWQAPKANPQIRAQLEAQDSLTLFQNLRERDPDSARRIGPNDRYRLIRSIELILVSGKTPTELQADRTMLPDPRFLLWIIDRDTGELEQRITSRTRHMLHAGLIEETRALRTRFNKTGGTLPRPLSAVGYKQVMNFLEATAPSGRKLKPGMVGLEEEIKLATRQLVKRQRTWFRTQPHAERFLLEGDRSKILHLFRALYTGGDHYSPSFS
jgi:tRNA dimethylallyltransferase